MHRAWIDSRKLPHLPGSNPLVRGRVRVVVGIGISTSYVARPRSNFTPRLAKSRREHFFRLKRRVRIFPGAPHTISTQSDFAQSGVSAFGPHVATSVYSIQSRRIPSEVAPVVALATFERLATPLFRRMLAAIPKRAMFSSPYATRFRRSSSQASCG